LVAQSRVDERGLGERGGTHQRLQQQRQRRRGCAWSLPGWCWVLCVCVIVRVYVCVCACVCVCVCRGWVRMCTVWYLIQHSQHRDHT